MRFYHGSAHAFQPGDLVEPSHEIGVRRGQKSYVYMTTSPEAARDYGRYKADALRAGYAADVTGHAYEVEPMGRYEQDPTVNERFGAYRTRYPLRVVRDITEPES